MGEEDHNVLGRERSFFDRIRSDLSADCRDHLSRCYKRRSEGGKPIQRRGQQFPEMRRGL